MLMWQRRMRSWRQRWTASSGWRPSLGRSWLGNLSPAISRKAAGVPGGRRPGVNRDVGCLVAHHVDVVNGTEDKGA